MLYMIVLFDSGPVAKVAESVFQLSDDANQLATEGNVVVFCDDLKDAGDRFGSIELVNPDERENLKWLAKNE